MDKKLITSIEKIISEACDLLEKRTPNTVWRTVCAKLLSTYPVDHPAWGYGSEYPQEPAEERPSITYNLLTHYSKKTMRSWIGIERCAYDIAQMSAVFDKRCSAMAEALRSIYRLYFRGSQRRRDGKLWKSLTICRLCWRLAPEDGGSTPKVLICENEKVHTIDFQTAVCDKHKSRTPEYQKAYRHLIEARKKIKTMLQAPDKKTELINSIFPINPNTEADHSPTTLAKLADIYPLAINYVSQQDKDPTDIKQLVEGLVGDSAEGLPGTTEVKIEIEKMVEKPGSILGHILHCEAWLQVYAEHTKGGKRKRAGRDPTKTKKLLKQKENLIADFNKGLKKSEIAIKYGISRSTLYQIYNQAKKENNFTE